jgi:hypothetical protein
MLLAVALVIAQSSSATNPEMSYMPGQLETVTGLRKCDETVMALYFGKDIDAQYTGSKIVPGGYVGYNFGYVRFSTREEDFLGLSVWHVHWVGHTTVKQGKKEYQLDAATDYWVDKTGKIRRQTASKTSALGHSEALCDYFPDHIQIQLLADGKSTEQLLYPAHDELAQLDDQFTPMVVDGKILRREKTYLCLDPYLGAFEKRKARVGGMFSGKELDAPFHGYEVNIELGGAVQGTCVSDENDLVRVDLQDGKAIVMTSLPASHSASGSSHGHGG